MKVAEVAQRAGVGVHAVRFYVRAGLLNAGRDPCNNYKQFGEPHVLRLRFIKGAQALGFSLAEIRALLTRMDSGECTCSAMHLKLADKILAQRQQIEDLVKRQAFMQRVYDDWRAGADGPHDLGRLCRYLERQAGADYGKAAGEPGALSSLGQPSAGRSVSRRFGGGPRPGAGADPAARNNAGTRARPVASHRSQTASGRTEGGLELLDLLNCEWRLPA